MFSPVIMYIYLRCMDTLSGEETLSFSFLPPLPVEEQKVLFLFIQDDISFWKCFIAQVPNGKLMELRCPKNLSTLALKGPITTAADDIHKYFFIVFQRK